MDEEQEKILKEFTCLCSSDEKVDKHLKVMREAAITCLKEFEKGTKMNNEEKKTDKAIDMSTYIIKYIHSELQEDRSGNIFSDEGDFVKLIATIVGNIILAPLDGNTKESEKLKYFNANLDIIREFIEKQIKTKNFINKTIEH